MSRRLLAPLVVALLLALSATASAATPKTTLNAVESEVMCVSCGVPLEIAESPQADRERALIRTLVARGLTKSQVKAELEVEYGPRVLALPKDEGFGLAAYLVPLALALAALALMAVLLPRWRRARNAAAVPGADGVAVTPALSTDDARRLDDDLARYEV